MTRKAVSSGRRNDGTALTASLFVVHHGPESSVDPPIILVHGAPDRSAAFRDVLVHLQGHRVIIYDRRGYGRSGQSTPAQTMADHARDLLGIAESCDTPPVVVAHSFGSNPTMLAATLKPTAFAAIGLWEPPLPWVAWWPERTKAYNTRVASSVTPADDIEEIYRRLLSEEAWDQLPSEVRARRRAEGFTFQADMASELEAPFRFEDVVVPALVGFGTETSAEHAYGARWLAEQLPNAWIYSIEGTGHFAPRTHPEEFAAFALATMPLAGR